jgi:hypothetical protein
MSFTGLQSITIGVRRRTIAADAMGGQAVTYVTRYTNRLARINYLSAEKQAILSRSGIMATHKFFCDGDMEIIADIDEIVYNGKNYRVLNVVNYSAATAENHHQTIYTQTPS